MPRLVSPTGITVNVSEEKAERLLSTGYRRPGGNQPAGGGEPQGYAEMTAKQLKAEIESRNADREDDNQLPTTGNKAALVAVLEQDDADPADDEDSEDEGDEPDSDEA